MAQNELVTEVTISRLAREIARDLRPLEQILEQMRVSSDDWERIQSNEFFKTRLVEEAQIWAGSTKQTLRDRISVKAATMVEELLFDTVAMVQDAELPGAARVAALQFLGRLGQLGDNASVTKDDGSGRVQINILLGDRKVTFDKDQAEPPMIDATPEVVAP